MDHTRTILAVLIFTIIGIVIFAAFQAQREAEAAFQHTAASGICNPNGGLVDINFSRGYPDPIAKCQDGTLKSGKW